MFKFFLICLAVGLSFLAKYLDLPVLLDLAQGVSKLFVNLLKLVGIPMIFLSIVSIFSSFSKFGDVQRLVGRTLFYVLLTTTIAAVVGLATYLIIAPSKGVHIAGLSEDSTSAVDWSYGTHLLSMFPDNIVKIFLDNNVMGCMAVSFLLGVACIFIDSEKREFLNKLFSAMFDMFLHAAGFVVHLMPIAVWGFITAFLYMPQSQDFSQGLTKYIFCVMLSGVIQAVVVLPLFMKVHRIPVLSTLRDVFPSLVTAFFSRSSVVTLPVTIRCVSDKLWVPKRIASFVLPLCATINMNACSSFMLITILFVCEVNAHVFSVAELIIWVLLSVVAAVGNAGVPMGCYFMSMSYLIYMKVPIHVMGLILPVYAIMDMFETALNVWSDICVTRVIGKKFRESAWVKEG